MKLHYDPHNCLLYNTYAVAGADRLHVTNVVAFALEPNAPLVDTDLFWQALDQAHPGRPFDTLLPKARSEVLLAGNCHPPDSEPVKGLEVRLKVASIKKHLHVLGDRLISAPSSMPQDPAYFLSMPLTWERTYGGEEHFNPEGTGYFKDAATAVYPVRAPNVVYADTQSTNSWGAPVPAGFAPMGLHWPERLKDLGTFDDGWFEKYWPGLPDDFDFSYCNLAPEDQRMPGDIPLGADIELHNLHPKKPVLYSSVPYVRVRCFALRKREKAKEPDAPETVEAVDELQMRPDTLWLFPNQELGALLFRGRLEVPDDEASDVRSLFAANEDALAEPLPFAHYRPLLFEEQEAEPPGEAPEPEQPEPAAEPGSGSPLAAKPPQIPDADLPDPKIEALKKEIAELTQQLERLAANAGISRGELNSLLNPPLKPAIPKTALPKLGGEEKLMALQKENAALERNLQKMLDHYGVDMAEPLLPPEVAHLLQPQVAAPKLRVADALINDLKKAHVDDPQLFGELRNLENELNQTEAQLDELRAKAKPPEIPDGPKSEPKPEPDAPAPEPQAPVCPRTREDVVDCLKNKRPLDGCDLSGLDLSRLDFTGASLRGAVLEKAKLNAAILDKADLSGAVLTEAECTSASLHDALLTGAVAAKAVFRQAALDKAHCEEADFTEADFTNARLNEAKLGKADFSKAILRQSLLSACHGPEVVFNEADLTGASLREAQFPKADFIQTRLADSDVADANLRQANFLGTQAKVCVFRNADMSECRINDQAAFVDCQFSHARLTGAALEDSRISISDLSRTDCTGLFASGCDFTHSDFSQARLRQCYLHKCDLREAVLRRADLLRGDLSKSRLGQADFQGANLFQANLYKAAVNEVTEFKKANLRGTLLEKGRLR